MPLIVAYALSGCAALIYEVGWTRLLAQQIGQSVWAVSTVLAAFMGGLAAGALLGGVWTSRLTAPQGLRAYASLEGAIAALALTIPIAMTAVTPMLSWVYSEAGGGAAFVVLRLTAALVLVGLPAAAMGATFPVAARAAAASAGQPASSANALYVSNTAGGCAGAALAGFLLIPRFGLSRTLWFAAALNLTAGLIALSLNARAVESAPLTPESEEKTPRAPRPRSARPGRVTAVPSTIATASSTAIAMAALCVTGFVALVQEVAWTRVIALTIGPTTYAFSTMLVLFILGLALGSSVGSRLAARVRRPRLALGAATALAGVAALAAAPAVGTLPVRVADLVRDPGASFATILQAEIWSFAWLLLPLSAAFGAAFPFALRVAVDDAESAPQKAALLYGVNTLGAIAGSLAAGFVLVPALGLQWTIQASGLCAIAGGIAVLATAAVRRTITAAAAVGFAILCGVVATATPWDAALLSAGAYKYAAYVRGPDLESALTAGTLLYYRDGAAGTVSVRRLAGALTLAIDGKVDASNAGDMQTQKLLAHVPLLLHSRPGKVAIIGLGSGVTLGAALTHPIDRADTIEISREVIAGASFFDRDNGHALADPRARTIVGDGRSHLLLTKTAYDVIISEPSNPWMAGVASLFTREFFLAARRSLAPGGIVCQWAHTYDISSGDLRSILATFATVFPDGTIWLVGEGDVLLVGSPGGIVPRLSTIEAAFKRSGVAADLAEVGVQDAASVLAMYAGGPGELQAYGAGAIVQTDDRGSLEFSAPRAIVGAGDDNAAALRRLTIASSLPSIVSGATSLTDAAHSRDRGRMYLKAEAYDLAYDPLQRAVTLNPDDESAVDAFVAAAAGSRRQQEAAGLLRTLDVTRPGRIPLRIGLSHILATMGDTEDALAQVASLGETSPDDPRPLEQVATILADAGDVERLRPVAERLGRRWPDRASAIYFAGTSAFLDGRPEVAERFARQGVTVYPNEARLHTLFGVASASLKRTDAARSAFERALALAPRDPDSYTNLGLLDLETGAAESATRRFAEALVLDPSSGAALRGLAQALRQSGHLDRAARVEQVVREAAGRPR
jgi:spermidine synthase